jgi:hypothetical protein
MKPKHVTFEKHSKPPSSTKQALKRQPQTTQHKNFQAAKVAVDSHFSAFSYRGKIN